MYLYYYSTAREKRRSKGGILNTKAALAELFEEIKVNRGKDPIMIAHLDELEKKEDILLP